MKNMLYVSVELKHSFSFDSTPSKLSSDIIRGIITEIRYKIENVVLLFDWAGSIFSFFFLYVFVKWVFVPTCPYIVLFKRFPMFTRDVLKLKISPPERALKYRKKYLTIESYDNKYLTQELYDLDERKRVLERPSILPLTRVEKNKLIEVWAYRVARGDKTYLFSARAVVNALHETNRSACIYGILAATARRNFSGRPCTCCREREKCCSGRWPFWCWPRSKYSYKWRSITAYIGYWPPSGNTDGWRPNSTVRILLHDGNVPCKWIVYSSNKYSAEGDRRECRRRRHVSGSIQVHRTHVQTGGQSNEHGHDELFTESVTTELRLLSAHKWVACRSRTRDRSIISSAFVYVSFDES